MGPVNETWFQVNDLENRILTDLDSPTLVFKGRFYGHLITYFWFVSRIQNLLSVIAHLILSSFTNLTEEYFTSFRSNISIMPREGFMFG